MARGSKKKKCTISGASGTEDPASTKMGKMSIKQDNNKRRSKLQPRGKILELPWRWGMLSQRTARKGEIRDWAAMPADALSAIFERLGAMNILLSAQFVCRSWQQAAHDPRVWRCVDFSTGRHLFGPDIGGDPFNEMVKAAVDRSKGLIEEFCIDQAAVDEIMLYMAHRCKSLKRLELIYCYYVSEVGLVQMLMLCPLLEDLCITHFSFVGDLFQNLLNRYCPPRLRRFSLNTRGCRNPVISNREARCIAHKMPQLRELQLFGNNLSNKGLRAILDSCLQLEILDLRQCFNIDLGDEDIKRRCCGIKKFLGPSDPTAFKTEIYDRDCCLVDTENDDSDSFDG